MSEGAVAYADSKTFYKVFKQVCDPPLKAAGMARCKASPASYFQPVEDGVLFVRFWAQVSTYGGRVAGNAFTINADLVKRDPQQPLFGSGARILCETLSDDDKHEAARLWEIMSARRP